MPGLVEDVFRIRQGPAEPGECNLRYFILPRWYHSTFTAGVSLVVEGGG